MMRQAKYPAQARKKMAMKVQRTVSDSNGAWPSKDSRGASNQMISDSKITPSSESTAGLINQEKNFFIEAPVWAKARWPA